MSAETMREAAAEASGVLVEFEEILRRISDADLHRAIPDGGWTVAQVVSHTHLSGLLWIAAVERLRHRPELTGFREEVGHDAGHLRAHLEQAKEILQVRGALPEAVGR